MTDSERKERKFEKMYLLVSAQLSGEITAENQRRLRKMLRNDAELRQIYVEAMQDASSLRWWAASCLPSDAAGTDLHAVRTRRPPQSSRFRLGPIPALVLGLSACVALVISFSSFPSNSSNEQREVASLIHPDESLALPPASDDSGVATILSMRNVTWGGSNAPTASELERLSVGQLLELKEGELEIVFDRAIQLAVRGPASLEIRSPLEVFSRHGALTARVGESGKGFVIETPSGRITDLGTEFSVAVNPQGSTDVAVIQGAVDLTRGPRESTALPSISRRLVQGQALSFDTEGNMHRLVAVDSARFPSLNGATRGRWVPASTIFVDIRDNIRDDIDAKSYRIFPGGLYEDAPAYVDRRHEWNGVDATGIPEPLLGADYVLPFNADKFIRDLEVNIRIGRPAVVYLFLSEKAGTPDWLAESFAKTDMVIGLDESGEFTRANYQLEVGPGNGVDTIFSVWKREVPEPATITVGTIRQAHRGWGYCMYGIAAVPLEPAP